MKNVTRRFPRAVNDLQPDPVHPIAVIWCELDARGWRVRDLAARMGNDQLLERALMFHYVHHPSRELELGRIYCDKLDRAFGLDPGFFFSLETAWCAHRRALASARWGCVSCCWD